MPFAISCVWDVSADDRAHQRGAERLAGDVGGSDAPDAPGTALGGVRARLSDVAARGAAEEANVFRDAARYDDADVDGVRMSFDRALAAQVRQRQPEHVRLTVPTRDGVLRLDLYRVQLTTEGATVTEGGDGSATAIEGVHYRGVVEDDDASLAAISMYQDGVSGFISTGARLYNLGKTRDSDDHLVYRADTLAAPAALGCDIDQLGEVQSSGAPRTSLSFVGDKYVGVYFEADFRMFQDHGSSVSETTNYITAMFNQVATLYANENVDLRIADLVVWTAPDPYASLNGTANVLTAFQSNVGTNYTGNLAFFLTTRPLNGGIAYVDVVCNKAYAFGVAAVLNNFANVPSYSWTVEVVAHELGHNLGSPHTQSCSWPGGALDNCWTPEGSCAPGPAPVNGGTVMSYCHMTSAGINFANGFGPQPGDLIRSRVTNASCLATATSDTTAPTVAITTPPATITAHTTVAIDVDAADDTGVTRVDLYQNDALAASDATAPWSFAWSTSGEPNGSYAFTARAFDAAGNAATSSAMTMVLDVATAVDTTPPTAPTNLAGTRKGRNLKLRWRASTDDVGVAVYLVVRNGAVIGQTTSTAATAGLPTGTNTFTVLARDAAGNVSQPSNAVVASR
ncbi:MAG: hypothetical protein A2138_16450 [Deltaproteobacteria bacterium RBG_16_71_12]|nr:MAG: hypothetical protein A2138_16450 [Deltaproteobacteria bacterium RBG_16_71_12]